MIDLPAGGVPEEDAALVKLKPRMDLAEQVQKYKYIINGVGHCAAMRMRDLLASDSAVLWMSLTRLSGSICYSSHMCITYQ